jgi:hypothetical protein
MCCAQVSSDYPNWGRGYPLFYPRTEFYNNVYHSFVELKPLLVRQMNATKPGFSGPVFKSPHPSLVLLSELAVPRPGHRGGKIANCRGVIPLKRLGGVLRAPKS